MPRIDSITILVFIISSLPINASTSEFPSEQFSHKEINLYILLPFIVAMSLGGQSICLMIQYQNRQEVTKTNLSMLPIPTRTHELQRTDFKLYDYVHAKRTTESGWKKLPVKPQGEAEKPRKPAIKPKNNHRQPHNRDDLDKNASHYLQTSALHDLLDQSAVSSFEKTKTSPDEDNSRIGDSVHTSTKEQLTVNSNIIHSDESSKLENKSIIGKSVSHTYTNTTTASPVHTKDTSATTSTAQSKTQEKQQKGVGGLFKIVKANEQPVRVTPQEVKESNKLDSEYTLIMVNKENVKVNAIQPRDVNNAPRDQSASIITNADDDPSHSVAPVATFHKLARMAGRPIEAQRPIVVDHNTTNTVKSDT